MTFKSVAVKTGIAAIALTSLGLVAAVPASAHTNNMYTLVAWHGEAETIGFATYSKTDGTAAFIGETYPSQMMYIAGIEIANEKGTVLGHAGDSDYVQEWDHKTGATSSEAVPLSLNIPGEERDYFYQEYVGLDTLNDGTTVTVIGYETDVAEGQVEKHFAIASVNSTNGQLTPLVDITLAIMNGDAVLVYEPTSLATDPTTGLTYVFLEDQERKARFLEVDVAAGTVSTSTLFGGPFYVEGAIDAADFEVDGTMFVNYLDYTEEEQQLELLRLGAPSTWATADPTFISLAPAQSPDTGIFDHALTIEHTALAATGSELPIAALVFGGALAVMFGGVTVVVARRRSEAGTI